ncbi:hypothetical protein SAMN05421636_1078 [Pricia antarctica]|uniref:Uncharacterized protein n=1 Tax=Pricia antarctica TaxID=641691 RepID=A0A1G7F8Z2_9FLAO|nr:hypothetical protein [Pricia antarctica]SDE72306.1 hypothetical protein SAMN05421636_1078 [Pricia antarctica]
MKLKYPQRLLPIHATIFFIVFATGILSVQVNVYEGTEVIPTYQKKTDETSPIFSTGRGVQGAQGKVYPYPSQTNLGSELVDVPYEMVRVMYYRFC